MELRLHVYPDPVLLRTAAPVADDEFDDTLREKIAAMFDLMYAETGVGLAGPQVGWDKQVLVLNPAGSREDESGARVVINPRIVKKWGKENGFKF